MKIVSPSVTRYNYNDTLDHIALCARICYASDKTTNNIEFCKALWANKHRSMFRHAGIYYIIPERLQVDFKAHIGSVVKLVGSQYYVSANAQSASEYWDTRYKKYRIDKLDAFNNKVFQHNKMLRYTLCIETGIDITREFNRKSPNNIAEQSTRYVDFNKKLGIRFKKCHWMYDCNLYRKLLYKFMLKITELFYKVSRSKYGLNLPPQDARFILPLDTMSKVVYTYTVKEWEEIINMRLWDYTGKAHPDAKTVASMIYSTLCLYGCKIDKYNKSDET